MKAGKYDVIRERARQFRERIDEAREVGLKRSAD
jgi:hypothetical protein